MLRSLGGSRQEVVTLGHVALLFFSDQLCCWVVFREEQGWTVISLPYAYLVVSSDVVNDASRMTQLTKNRSDTMGFGWRASQLMA